MNKFIKLTLVIMFLCTVSVTLTSCGAFQSLSHDDQRGFVNGALGIANYYGAFD